MKKKIFIALLFSVFFGAFAQSPDFKIKNAIRAIEARPLSEKVADLLHQTPGEPSLYMSSVTYLDNGRACMYTRQYFHGNHFRFVHNFEK